MFTGQEMVPIFQVVLDSFFFLPLAKKEFKLFQGQGALTVLKTINALDKLFIPADGY